MALVTRQGKGSKLTSAEMDGNLTYLEQLATESGGSEYTETIVNISSAQILGMGTNPIELLPAAGEGKYYDIEKIVFEYNNGTIPYTLADDYIYTVIPLSTVDKQILTSNNNSYAVSSPRINGASNTEPYAFTYPVVNAFNSKLELTTWYNNNPTDGDGTLRVKIYHKTITFGA